MLNDNTHQQSYAWRCGRVFLLGIVVLGTAVSPICAQNNDGAKAPYTVPPADYTIGPGDVLTITVSYTADIGGKVRVSEDGFIIAPGLPKPVKAVGLTPAALGAQVKEDLKQAQIVRDPIVGVFVDEYHSRTISVLGAVTNPLVYPLNRATTILEAISMAGGLLPTAGGQMTLIRKGHDLPIGHIKGDTTVLSIDLGKLMAGSDPSLNLKVEPGDVLTVATAPVVYVVGAVVQPGGYVLDDPTSNFTVLQAIAKAQGTKPTAATNRAFIVRRSPEGQERKQIPVDLSVLMKGKGSDLDLQRNDILFVPESGMKKTMQMLTAAAIQGATGVVTYGAGYRLAR
ncbi:MAG: polysaccharide biosynthesis/export family protein [Bryobacteraceae bacterium]|jgi:polysaccharide export outer membrane protein